ncbi:MAG TPA: DUF5302 domain-containing protein [Jiangellales bacterium]|nr:DUF5302 domain-containing protein [Jiangellales bacterium]
MAARDPRPQSGGQPGAEPAAEPGPERGSERGSERGPGSDPGSGPGSGPGSDPERGGADAQDDVRARFRAALERKQAAHHGTAAGPDDTAHGPHSATGPAKKQRQFRRKSG